MKKIYIGDSQFAGKGVFAKRLIKKGEIVFIVKGKEKKLVVTNEKNALYGDRWIAVDKNTWIDPFPTNPWYFINHSCNPNVGVKGRVTLRAMKDIKKDEEITLDYSSNEPEKLWWMRCFCGEKKCRKKIRGALATDRITIKRYMPYVSNYVKKLLSL